MQYSVSPRVNDKQLRTEAEREGQHADADAPRGQEMPELVDEHEHAEHEDEREKMLCHS